MRHIKSYNALRGIAAIFILMSHLLFLKESDSSAANLLYEFLMSNGGKFTSFFYISSGFLTCYTWKKQSFKVYFNKKINKIYPLAMGVFVLALVLDIVLSGNAINDVSKGSLLYYICIVLNITMLKAAVPIKSVYYSFHGPSWFLTALFAFYIIAYTIMPKITSENHEIKMRSIKKLKLICIIAYIAEFIICIVAHMAFYSNSNEDVGICLWLTYINPLFRIFGECFLGVILCLVLPEITKKIKNKTCVELFALVSLAFFYIIQIYVGLYVFRALLWGAVVSLLLLAFYDDAGKCSEILKCKCLQWIGDISFELYMTHAFVYEGMPVALKMIGLGEWIISHAIIRFAITIPMCLIFAWLVHTVIYGIRSKKEGKKCDSNHK